MVKARKNRFTLFGIATLLVAAGVYLIFSAINENMVFFYSPSEVIAKKTPENALIRIGGIVERGSLIRTEESNRFSFEITDTQNKVLTYYEGMLPALFKEGKGVVAQGKLDKEGVFHATEVLAKHDENYMPPEAKAAIDTAHRARDMKKK